MRTAIRKPPARTHFNKLTPAEAERLALLLEELGEAQQVIGKILRHGYESQNPYEPGNTNRMLLESELGDVKAAVDLVVHAGDVNENAVEASRQSKLQGVGRWTHRQPAALFRNTLAAIQA
jgi:hypothetical protein